MGAYVSILTVACCALWLAGGSSAYAESCLNTTPQLEAMGTLDTYLEGPEGQRIELTVRVADNRSTLSAGFQHICPRVAETTSILFVLESVRVPSFHMQNVHMPLDIAFLDENGVIRDIQTMQPYVLGMKDPFRTWRPPVPVRFALEVQAGFYERFGVTAGQWTVAVPQLN